MLSVFLTPHQLTVRKLLHKVVFSYYAVACFLLMLYLPPLFQRQVSTIAGSKLPKGMNMFFFLVP